LERVIDDFVLMCILCGNDFLPTIPSLKIEDDSINTLLNVYQKELYLGMGYISDGGEIDLKRFSKFIEKLCEFEEFTFKLKLKERILKKSKIEMDSDEEEKKDENEIIDNIKIDENEIIGNIKIDENEKYR
jgi:5'-3' exoribonuclease 2